MRERIVTQKEANRRWETVTPKERGEWTRERLRVGDKRREDRTDT